MSSLKMMMMMMMMNDDELFLWYGWPTKGVSPYFQPGPLSEILTTTNLWHTARRVWKCAEPEFRLSWMKSCSSDNHYTTATKLLFFEKTKQIRISSNKTNTRIQQSHSKYLYISSFCECSSPRIYCYCMKLCL